MAVTIKNKLQKSAVTIIAAAPAPAIAGNALEVEDEFTPYYNAEGGGATGHILKPPYDPRQLEKMTQENNTLGPCIEAMVVNIDGTGHEIEKIDMNPDEDEEEEEDPVALRLEAFFKEPYPGVSFMTIRRDLRRDLERTGNGYLEVLRNIVGQIVFLRHVPARTIRLVKLDKAISAKKTVKRNGEDVTFNVMVRERRYVQLMSGQLLFFREFGSTRDLDKKKGKWGTPMSPVAPDKRATELIHFQVGQDPNSPYGVPRWEGAIPSVLGSREAEETNLTYLKTGGLPPALIMVQGGMMAEEAKKSITEQFSPGHKMRAAIVEVASTEGSMDKPGSVKVSVERFGSENMKDSMFEGYDANCKERVLHCFRIPPLFVGNAADHNFACYDDQTETLTDAGWIKYDQFKPGMKIACYNPDEGRVEFHEPHENRALVYDFDGDLVRFKGQRFDMAVTPNHRMYFRTGQGGWRIDRADEMAKLNRTYVRNVVTAFECSSPLESVEFDINGLGRVRKEVNLGANDFLELAGFVISEGCLAVRGGSKQITVYQTKEPIVVRLDALFGRMESAGIKVYRVENSSTGQVQWTFSSASMYDWLSENCGHRAANKHIARELLNLPPDQLKVLFDSLMAGDGTWDSREGRTSGAYSTTSVRLADDFQELAFRLGYRAKIRKDLPGTYGDKPVYRVLLQKEEVDLCVMKDQVTAEHYNGKVYCFSVPHGLFVTRRNGVIAIQGNTAYASYITAEAQVFGPEREHFDEIMTMKLLPALGGSGYKFKSKPITIKDATAQVAGIGEAAGIQGADPKSLIDSLNDVLDLNIEFSEEQQQTQLDQQRQEAAAKFGGGQFGNGGAINQDAAAQKAGLGAPRINPTTGAVTRDPPKASPMMGQGLGVVKSDNALKVMELADRLMVAMRVRKADDVVTLLQEANTLPAAEKAIFDRTLAYRQFLDPSADPEGLASIAGCTVALIQNHVMGS